MSYVMVYLYDNQVSQLPRCMLPKSNSGSWRQSIKSFLKVAIVNSLASNLAIKASSLLVKPFT